MKHIDVRRVPLAFLEKIKYIGDASFAVCKNFKEGDKLVKAAMSSDCNDCRGIVMVQPVEMSKVKKEGDVSVPVNVFDEPSYTAEPMADADKIKVDKKEAVNGFMPHPLWASEIKKKRNGVKKKGA